MDLSLSGNMILMLLVAAGVGGISAAIVTARAASLTSPEDLAAKGLAAVRKERVSFYGVLLPLVAGFLSYYAYRLLQARWPATAATIFFWLALVAALGFTALAAVVFKKRGLAEMAALHLLYAVGFGAVLPRLLALV